jgi:AcrR family transcriptional regulator
MRAVSRAARTNTPALYRRFKDREDLIRGLLRRTATRIRQDFEAQQTIEEMAEAYVEAALRLPHEYELFYTHARALNAPRGTGRLKPVRESRPNFALLESRLADRLGGAPDDHTQLALAMWSMLHGVTMLLLCKAIPPGHEEELRSAGRSAVKALLDGAEKFPERK